ncbi:MAG: Holliday junction resolvase [Dehalococcoidales bacterium]|nr:Holliday junction resolvase [Dehalococcoidales bacterium]
METAGIIAVSVVVVILVIIISNYIIRAVYEKRFREEIEQACKDAVSKSRAVLGGKFTEQMVPFFPDFEYDPTEVRFIGSPIDMIVFPGLAQGEPQGIVILEVKTGKKSGLTPLQKKIRQLVDDKKVYWDEVHQKGEGEP